MILPPCFAASRDTRLVDIWLRMPELFAGESSMRATVPYFGARVVRGVRRKRYEGVESS